MNFYKQETAINESRNSELTNKLHKTDKRNKKLKAELENRQENQNDIGTQVEIFEL